MIKVTTEINGKQMSETTFRDEEFSLSIFADWVKSAMRDSTLTKLKAEFFGINFIFTKK